MPLMVWFAACDVDNRIKEGCHQDPRGTARIWVFLSHNHPLGYKGWLAVKMGFEG